MYYREQRGCLSVLLDIPAEVLSLVFMFLLCSGGFFLWNTWASALGVEGHGPVRQYDVVVVSKHIDAQKDSSSYMVNGDTQTFEVDNGPLLGMWNADVVYGQIIVGERYCFTAKGNQVTDWWWQQYPYILEVVKGGC